MKVQGKDKESNDINENGFGQGKKVGGGLRMKSGVGRKIRFPSSKRVSN